MKVVCVIHTLCITIFVTWSVSHVEALTKVTNKALIYSTVHSSHNLHFMWDRILHLNYTKT